MCCAEHLPDVFKHPDSDIPIPYTELLITATPGYKRRDPGAVCIINAVDACCMTSEYTSSAVFAQIALSSAKSACKLMCDLMCDLAKLLA